MPWYTLYIGQNKLWLEAHSYKRLISIFEGVAFELLFGLGQNRLNISTDRAESKKCPTNTL